MRREVGIAVPRHSRLLGASEGNPASMRVGDGGRRNSYTVVFVARSEQVPGGRDMNRMKASEARSIAGSRFRKKRDEIARRHPVRHSRVHGRNLSKPSTLDKQRSVEASENTKSGPLRHIVPREEADRRYGSQTNDVGPGNMV